jgi:hypothetical protein
MLVEKLFNLHVYLRDFLKNKLDKKLSIIKLNEAHILKFKSLFSFQIPVDISSTINYIYLFPEVDKRKPQVTLFKLTFPTNFPPMNFY